MRDLIDIPPLRPRSRRWLVPVAVAVLVMWCFHQLPTKIISATQHIDSMSGEQILERALGTNVEYINAVVNVTSSLGAPQYDAPLSAPSVEGLLNGQHSIRLWSMQNASTSSARIEIHGEMHQTNMVLNREGFWAYRSDTSMLAHASVDRDAIARKQTEQALQLFNPYALAKSFLGDANTANVRVEGASMLFGKPARAIRISADYPNSLIGDVVIVVDAHSFIPLDVQMHARSTGARLFEVEFSQVSFSAIDKSVFGPNYANDLVHRVDDVFGMHATGSAWNLVIQHDVAINSSSPGNVSARPFASNVFFVSDARQHLIFSALNPQATAGVVRKGFTNRD